MVSAGSAWTIGLRTVGNKNAQRVGSLYIFRFGTQLLTRGFPSCAYIVRTTFSVAFTGGQFCIFMLLLWYGPFA